jgi:two-component system response regulator FixJ
MQLLIRGLSNKEIGQQLGISPRTVEIHRTWVMTKMSARSIADLVRMGMALGVE